MQRNEGVVRATQSYSTSGARSRTRHRPREAAEQKLQTHLSMTAALHTSPGVLCARRLKGKVPPAIIERLRGATALHTTTHRRPQTSVRAGPFDYRLSHMRPRGRLRGEGEGRGGLQCTAVAGDLDVTDTDPTRASRQRGGPQLTHVEKDRGRSKRKMLAVKSRATGFPFSSPTSSERGSPSPCPPFGAHKSSRLQASPAAARPGPPSGPVTRTLCSLWG